MAGGEGRKAFEWGSGNAEGGKGRMGKDAPSAIKNTYQGYHFMYIKTFFRRRRFNNSVSLREKSVVKNNKKS